MVREESDDLAMAGSFRVLTRRLAAGMDSLLVRGRGPKSGSAGSRLAGRCVRFSLTTMVLPLCSSRGSFR
jgi:hypothetical protein